MVFVEDIVSNPDYSVNGKYGDGTSVSGGNPWVPDGKEVTSENPTVLSYVEKVDRQGNRYRQITDIQQFTSYQEALDIVESQGSGNRVIVGINAFISPITLEVVQDYKLIYSSDSSVYNQDAGVIPEVKIFEYTR